MSFASLLDVVVAQGGRSFAMAPKAAAGPGFRAVRRPRSAAAQPLRPVARREAPVGAWVDRYEARARREEARVQRTQYGESRYDSQAQSPQCGAYDLCRGRYYVWATL